MGVVLVLRGREALLRLTNSPWTGCLPDWLPALKHPLVHVGLITRHGVSMFCQRIPFQSDLNPRCSQGGQNIAQSNYVPNLTHASPEGGLSIGEVQVILIRLQPSVVTGMAARKKSRIL